MKITNWAENTLYFGDVSECVVDNTCLSGERLKTLIREVFRKEFEKQQKNLLNLISGNLEITMKEIKSIKTEMNDLKMSIELTENAPEEKVQKCQEKAEP